MPKISVIMPVYNTAQYLEESIDSIINQTLNDIEILIVDDGSTDGSGFIIDRYAKIDTRIHHIKQSNQGQSIARNSALEIAIGEYIYFMDSDDILENDALYNCYMRCNNNNLDIAFFDGDLLYEKDSKEICWDYHRSFNYDEHITYIGQELLSNMLDLYTFRAVPWLYLVKREKIRNLDLLFYPNIIHEDELFTFLLFLQSDRIGCIKNSLIRHRIRTSSTMSKTYSMFSFDCYIEVLLQVKKFKMNNLCYSDIIDKYTKYTLNAVCLSASSLTLHDKIKLYQKCYDNKLARFISIKSLLKLFI